MSLNPLASELNQTIAEAHPTALDHLSRIGKALFFPKGILTQSAEAKTRAHRYNATIGIATEGAGPMHLAAVQHYFHDLDPSEIYPYAPSFGLPALRQAWAAKQRAEMPAAEGQEFSLPVVCNALTHALSVVGEMVIDAGDVVLLPDQLWGNYRLTWGTQRGAEIRTFPFFDDSLSTFNIAAFTSALDKQDGAKTIVVLNFPNNPTGYHPSKAEAAAIVQTLTDAAASGKRLVVICDDAYCGMFFDAESETQPLFAWLARAHPNLLAIKVDGGTKEAFIWGLRVGFITYGIQGGNRQLYEALEKKTAGSVRGSISNVSMPAQSILAKALANPDFIPQQAAKVAILRQRFEAVREAVFDPQYADCWQAYPFNAGYFMCLRLKDVDAEAARLDLLERHGVGTIALGGGDLRVAFSCLELEQIADCFARIADSVRHLRAS
ncbi:MAG: aminotransferase class I/II-fold pyridoxal phosphate-dependent enzyme [Planctomycetota bacterium]|nr:MAG: aminotransferase class I/II-fold pyridoxal phosphate-dependent enzyme [Planctomycetota bacterium]